MYGESLYHLIIVQDEPELIAHRYAQNVNPNPAAVSFPNPGPDVSTAPETGINVPIEL